MSVSELNKKVQNGEIVLHHAALNRGYISRKSEGTVVDYKGYFGKGFKVFLPNWDSTRYCVVAYYIYAQNEQH